MTTFSLIQNQIPQVNQKPLFSQPIIKKMAEQEMEMTADADIKPCNIEFNLEKNVQFFQSPSIESRKTENRCRSDKFETLSTEESDMSLEEQIIEIDAIDPVSKGLWRSVSKSSKTVYIQEVEEVEEVEEVSQEASEAQAEESSDEEVEDLEQAIEEMKQMIKDQHCSKASRYQQIIRESAEFAQSDLEVDSANYESLKSEVVRILRQKIDMNNYKYTIK